MRVSSMFFRDTGYYISNNGFVSNGQITLNKEYVYFDTRGKRTKNIDINDDIGLEFPFSIDERPYDFDLAKIIPPHTKDYMAVDGHITHDHYTKLYVQANNNIIASCLIRNENFIQLNKWFNKKKYMWYIKSKRHPLIIKCRDELVCVCGTRYF